MNIALHDGPGCPQRPATRQRPPDEGEYVTGCCQRSLPTDEPMTYYPERVTCGGEERR